MYESMNSTARMIAWRVLPWKATRQPPMRCSSTRKIGSATTERMATASITG